MRPCAEGEALGSRHVVRRGVAPGAFVLPPLGVFFAGGGAAAKRWGNPAGVPLAGELKIVHSPWGFSKF